MIPVRFTVLAVLLLPGIALAQDTLPALPAIQIPDVPGAPTGRLAGVVLDRETGRPIPGARILVVGRPGTTEADLNGRYRVLGLPARSHTVRAMAIGYQPLQIDSVLVAGGQTVSADFALLPVALQVEGITVEAAAVARPSSEASLLALQQAAASVSDGISAEAISRTPDADAADAITRVTGISVVDNKFVVVRGLPERYNNTLLNGAELVSPEPNRRVVPLDIFPASLLEAVVTTKAATPDKPGDFAGGSVEIRTRDFPEEFVFQVNTSQGYNSQTTFRAVPLVPRGFGDFLGFDNGRRQPPPDPANGAPIGEAFAEGIRNVWTPALQRARPSSGIGVNVGGQAGGATRLGYALSWTHNSGTEFRADRTFALVTGDPSDTPNRFLRYTESNATVDWGALANFTLQLGGSHKISWRNLYTRNAEEPVRTASGFDSENARVVRLYQVAYVEQAFLQSLLAGEHQLAGLLHSRFEWRASLGFANRDEPDNRQLYTVLVDDRYAMINAVPATLWTRYLDDRLRTVQGDWSVPFSLRSPQDAQLKVGGLLRHRRRVFDARLYRWALSSDDPLRDEVASLPPEELFAPENVGGPLTFQLDDAASQSYTSEDRITSGYFMLDLFALRGVRLVGGMRMESWRLDMFPQNDTVAIVRDEPRALWSANITLSPGARTNIRLAGFQSVSRPDPRELSPTTFVPVSGQCQFLGNRDLQSTDIVNLDARYEYYRAPGEILSASVFYKRFERPIVESVDIAGGGDCRVNYKNTVAANNYGVELEWRRALDFMPGALRHVSLGVNVTMVHSRVQVDSASFGVVDPNLALAGQSPLLVNGNIGFAPPGSRFQLSMLVNYFADRIIRYGVRGVSGQNEQAPNVEEVGRVTVDAKVQMAVTSHLNLSLSGRNLTDAASRMVQRRDGREAVAGYERPGMGLSVGLGYAF